MNLRIQNEKTWKMQARRDAMRKMTWFALMGMLLYPGIFVTSFLGQEKAGNNIGDIAPTYFVHFSNWSPPTLVQMQSR